MENKLPLITTDRIAIKLKSKVEKFIRAGHPWIFESGIAKQSKAGKAGDLAIIFDQRKNKFMGIGLYDPDSPIRIKMLQFKIPATIDEAWFQQRIEAAYKLRLPLLSTNTNSYRLIFGENDGMPSLIADVYSNVLVVKIYSLIWFPYLSQILPILKEKSGAEAVVLRLSRNLQAMPDRLHGLKDGTVVIGQLEDEEVVFKEYGLKFTANVIHGHKTGYFLDHRHNRRKIGALAEGKRVLDVFSYAGGFSVHALAGGAKEVISLDISAQALEMAQKNAKLNNCQKGHSIMTMDAFEALEKLHVQQRKFDIVVVDPPSFAKKDSEKERALKSYHQLAKLAARLVQKNGILFTASCSSRVQAEEFFDVVEKALHATDRRFEVKEKTFHDLDHPINFPEGAYLKAGYYQIF